tara:strand:- start:57 stop:380 length:324 start_codon:yes stop_codon:yes gene_type:complete
MPSWVVDVLRIHKLTDSIDRLVLADDLLVDVPTQFLKVGENERISVDISEAKTAYTGGVCLCGIVYANGDGVALVSCGGLLCRVPAVLENRQMVFVSVNKSRRRRRE